MGGGVDLGWLWGEEEVWVGYGGGGRGRFGSAMGEG